MTKWDRVEIVWEDAWSDYSSVFSERFVREYKPKIRHSIGFLLAKTKTHVMIAMDNDVGAKDDSTTEDCQTVTTVPLGMVREIIVLKPVVRGRKP